MSNLQWIRRPFSFGTTGALLLAVIAVIDIPIGWMSFIQFSRQSSALGFYVTVRDPSAYDQISKSAVAGPMVRIESPTRWYLNAHQLSPTELPIALRNLLKTRSDWTVYVVANPNVEFGTVVAAMDVIRAEQAHIVLLTAN